MTVVLAILDPAVLLRYIVCQTNIHQTQTVLALICHQVNGLEQNIKNLPLGFENLKIIITNQKTNAEWRPNHWTGAPNVVLEGSSPYIHSMICPEYLPI